ncbi:DUF222 domain-containing protein [uncultured Friedmanniella sp.]|uniref:HNH endonuclease signature motif containing protein n=1 Tax=uncultured Friedmanniella sp. TaxID=335381 RepID=UPI0035CA3D1B
MQGGPTPQQVAVAEERAVAEVLAGRICAAAAMVARSQSQLLELVGEFDAVGAVRWWSGVKSLAHWLSWMCSMSPGTAREHVRVARALRRMPTVQAAFADGRLSYAKVREITRVVDVVAEAELCTLALTATASQLARSIAGYRTADGMRLPAEVKRTVRWRSRDDGMVELTARLPAEEAAVVQAALTAAKDQYGAPPAAPSPDVNSDAEQHGGQVDTQPRYTNADALLDVARRFVHSAPTDQSGEDRTLVVVHVAADQLGTQLAPTEEENVPAGTFSVPAEAEGSGRQAVCHVEGVGPVEPETARRLACDATLLGALVDRHGDVLALGRTRRLVSKAQRRALMIRDRMCQFDGCAQTRHLQAHHRISWADGGPTDLDNLILLCQFHQTCVHEGGITVARRADGEARPWEFRMPDGTAHRPWYTAERLPATLTAQLQRRQHEQATQLAGVNGLDHPDARTIRPGWAGERFDLHATVHALFGLRLPEPAETAAQPQAAAA